MHGGGPTWLKTTSLHDMDQCGATISGMTVRYTVRFPEPHTHYSLIEALLPSAGESHVDVFLPVWTPGSYLVREFARNIESVQAESADRVPLTVLKTHKNRWRIDTGGAREVRLSYRLYCREMSVRTNWVEDGFALLHGAATFLTLTGGLRLSHEVSLELPEAWRITLSGMTETGAHTYRAADYDTLVDCPILAGNPVVHVFEAGGVPHYLANLGEDGVWDGKRAAADVEKIVQSHLRMWKSLPYDKYVFLNLITESGGGLEHANSVCMMTSRWSTGTRKAYLSWLSLASHEYFHVWNVKRLRPVELGPFDYERENYTRSLWIAEGITDYYAPLMLRRAGLTDRDEYLNGADGKKGGLSGVVHTLQTTPGRLAQSVEDASFDAWIKLYRPDENTANTTISYYTKGTVVAWLLDARIRKATSGAGSLDDVMRLAYARYGGARGFSPEQFQATAEEVAGVPLRDFFRQAVESTEELDYGEALEWFGLRFRDALNGDASGGVGKAWLGAETKVDNGRLVATKIPRGTPAFAAGIDVDDEILALGDYRVRADQLGHRLENYRPGDRVSVLVARRDKLARIEVALGEEPSKKWQLEVLPGASAEQRLHLEAWLTAV